MVASKAEQPDPAGLELHGGHPALDFVNTIDPRTGPLPHVDHIGGYGALCRWAGHASLIEPRRTGELLEAGRTHPRRAAAVWRRSIALREALHGVLTAVVAGREPTPAELELVAGEFRDAQAHVDFVPARGGPTKGAPAFRPVLPDELEPEALLRRLALAAAELLTDVDATRLRVCPGDEDGCGWVVLDTTRNRSRRWCDMTACGNSVKSARLTERRRAARSGGSPTA